MKNWLVRLCAVLVLLASVGCSGKDTSKQTTDKPDPNIKPEAPPEPPKIPAVPPKDTPPR